MKQLVFIKLGGSIITNKNEAMQAHNGVISSIAKAVAGIIKKRSDLQFIIGNGAGSFGHYQVIEHDLKNGISKTGQWYGYSIVQDAVAQLNRKVVAAFLKEGIAMTSIQPSAILMANNGKLQSAELDSFKSLLESGVVPSVYGDIIPDTQKGCTIFSTETLFDILISELLKDGNSIHSVIHLTQVPGLLDKNNAVISEVTKETWSTLKQNIANTDGYDITGGMLHKIESALQYASKGITTLIIDGNHPGEIQNYLQGEAITGTIIR